MVDWGRGEAEIFRRFRKDLLRTSFPEDIGSAFLEKMSRNRSRSKNVPEYSMQRRWK